MANMVLLPVTTVAKPVSEFKAAERWLRDHLPGRVRHLVEPNLQALWRGFQGLWRLHF